MDIARPDLVAQKKKKKFALIAVASGLSVLIVATAFVVGSAPPSVDRSNVLVDTVR